MKHIGIVGTGFMGSAVIRAIVREHGEVQLGMVEKDGSRRDWATRELGAQDFSSKPEELFGFADIVILAIKPQDLADFGEQVGAAARNALVLSMLAGTSIEAVGRALGTRRVVRIMPNLAADIGKAVTGISFSPELDRAMRSEVIELLRGIGTLVPVREELIAAVTGISGSGIAFALEFIHALTLGGVEQGLPYAQAAEAARDVVESAALLLRATGDHPEAIISRVCSPGGTTIRGIRTLHERGATAAVMAAVEAATARSRELEG
ncbi:MAG: pyrroline-5-carboxylate reductase [Spirochaeta sp.]|jgi:pyrroline-5-carboxylate reductase|nr:pyrroline-5-carboxylate reductase [Spirochaeta sp.]